MSNNKIKNTIGREKGIASFEKVRQYVKEREQVYREMYGEDILCLSSTGEVLITGKEERIGFFEIAQRYAQKNDPVYVGTIDNFLQDGNVERIYGEGYSKYRRGKYTGANL